MEGRRDRDVVSVGVGVGASMSVPWSWIWDCDPLEWEILVCWDLQVVCRLRCLWD